MSWDKDALWAKSKSYVDRALGCDRDGPEFGFWMSLALELLARATIASVSPVLLAEPDKEMNNALYALGVPIGKARPKSIPVSSVFALCRKLVPAFTEEDLVVCTALTDRRNEELHSGSLPFDNWPTSIWLTRFYRAAKSLCEKLGKGLNDFLGNEEFAAADKMLKSDSAQVKEKVKKTINAHKTIFDLKTDDDKKARRLASEAQADAMSHHGHHKVTCPACGSKTSVTGESVSTKEPMIENDQVVIRETMLPTNLECQACGLSLDSHAEVEEAGVGGQFTHTVYFEPLEWYGDSGPADEYDNE